MTVQEKPYPVVGRVIDIFGEWLKHRRELREMREMDAANFGRIASELRMSSADLEALVRRGPHAADELPKMLAALGIDQDIWRAPSRWCCVTWSASVRCAATSASATAISPPAPPPRTTMSIAPTLRRSTASARRSIHSVDAFFLLRLQEKGASAAKGSVPHRRDRIRNRDRALGHVGMQPLHHPPSSWMAPREAFSGLSNAAMILRACSTSSAGGVKMALHASIWLGWISVLPSKPRSRPLRAFGRKAVDIADVAVGPVENFEPVRARRQDAVRDHRDHRRAARLHADPRLPRYVVGPEHEACEPVSESFDAAASLSASSTPRAVSSMAQTRIDMSALMSLRRFAMALRSATVETLGTRMPSGRALPAMVTSSTHQGVVELLTRISTSRLPNPPAATAVGDLVAARQPWRPAPPNPRESRMMLSGRQLGAFSSARAVRSRHEQKTAAGRIIGWFPQDGFVCPRV
jgi:hypothetical protein